MITEQLETRKVRSRKEVLLTTTIDLPEHATGDVVLSVFRAKYKVPFMRNRYEAQLAGPINWILNENSPGNRVGYREQLGHTVFEARTDKQAMSEAYSRLIDTSHLNK